MTTPANDKNSLDTKSSNPGVNEKYPGQSAESPVPYGIAPPVAPTAPSENEKFLAGEIGLSSVPNQSVGPGQNSVGNYYAPVHTYAPPGFNGGDYIPLQPISNLPPANLSAEPTAPRAFPVTDPVFSAGQPGPPVPPMPITVQPTPSGQPVIGFMPPPAYDQPITSQPMFAGTAPMNYGAPPLGPTEGWMAPPPLIPVDCPPGLEYLTTIDSLFVKQKVELLEAFTGFETNNKYSIRNKDGDKVFYVIEDNDCCNRNCCGSVRSFVLRVFDKSGTEIIEISRDLRCDSCLFPCCLQELKVYSPPGNLVGTVVQQWAICQPIFDINDDEGKTVLKIEGPVCQCSMCGDVDFNVLSVNREAVVGKISKQWSGLAREFFTDADNFGISFPLDLAVRMKAVMIGACFLVDFMYFETPTDSTSSCVFIKCITDCLNLCIITDSCSGSSGGGGNDGNCCSCGSDDGGCCGDGDGCCEGDGGCCEGGDGCCEGDDGCCDGADGDCCDGGGGDCGDCGDCGGCD